MEENMVRTILVENAYFYLDYDKNCVDIIASDRFEKIENKINRTYFFTENLLIEHNTSGIIVIASNVNIYKKYSHHEYYFSDFIKDFEVSEKEIKKPNFLEKLCGYVGIIINTDKFYKSKYTKDIFLCRSNYSIDIDID